MKFEGFGNETALYRNIAQVILLSLIDIIKRTGISYNLQETLNRISSLNIVKRDGETHEYVDGTNTLYLSTTNGYSISYSDEDIIIFLTHELMHFGCANDNEFYKEYFGFDEFFTEYLTFVVVSKCGGINMESYYKRNVQGYFDESDNNLMKNLIDKYGYSELLDIYMNRNKEKARKIIGQSTLQSFNEYHNYYDELTDLIGRPLRECRKIIQNSIMKPQKDKLCEYVNLINQSISFNEPLGKTI